MTSRILATAIHEIMASIEQRAAELDKRAACTIDSRGLVEFGWGNVVDIDRNADGFRVEVKYPKLGNYSQTFRVLVERVGGDSKLDKKKGAA